MLEIPWETTTGSFFMVPSNPNTPCEINLPLSLSQAICSTDVADGSGRSKPATKPFQGSSGDHVSISIFIFTSCIVNSY